MRVSTFAGAAMSIVLAAITPSALAQDMPASGANSSSDASFVKKVAHSDMYEIEASKLAQTKAKSADVKSFAAKMVSDHKQTSEQLKSIVASKSEFKLPQKMDSRRKTMIDQLRAQSGADFDQLYAVQQINAHNAAIMLFTRESHNGQDADLKKFAADTLPTLQKHLAMAQALRKGGAAP